MADDKKIIFSMVGVSKAFQANKQVLKDIYLSFFYGAKIGIIGLNGSGKSTLLKIIAGLEKSYQGEVVFSPGYSVGYLAQEPHLDNDKTVKEVVMEGVQNVVDTLAEYEEINNKFGLPEYYEDPEKMDALFARQAELQDIIDSTDAWNLDSKLERAMDALRCPPEDQLVKNLSGGERRRVALCRLLLQKPDILLLDEPTNHLDDVSRGKLYRFITSTSSGMLVVSHDRILLNLLSSTYELTSKGVIYYAGNYDFYKEQKELAVQALQARLEENGKQLQKARRQAREVMERQQKHDVRGKKQNIKSGVGKMAMNTFKDQAEKSSVRLNNVHTDKIHSLAKSVTDIRSELPDMKTMRLDFNSSSLHIGKVLVTAKNLNYAYQSEELWKSPLSFVIQSGDRIHLKGANGSGKTTLLKLLTGTLSPTAGELTRMDGLTCVYLDQEYSIIHDDLSVFEQLFSFNNKLYDHELKTILNRFLFPVSGWDKKCSCLSGGEKMRLSLCCLMVSAQTPDLFIVDEPTNNIDIMNMEILTDTLKEYRGTLLVVSHDACFVQQINIEKTITLNM